MIYEESPGETQRVPRERVLTSAGRIARSSPQEVFLAPACAPELGAPPLTPFMQHVALQRSIALKDLDDPVERASFVFWFIEEFQPARAPYRWPIAPEVLKWLNAPAVGSECSQSQGGVFLTRLMEHVRSQAASTQQRRLVDDWSDFVVWFAFEFLPMHSLPGALLPDEVIDALNEPVSVDGIPLTKGLWLRARMRYPEHFSDITSADPAALMSASHQFLTEALAIGEPRLIPPFVSRYWSSETSETGSSRYLYTAARAFCGALTSTGEWNKPLAEDWFCRDYLEAVPEASAFAPRPWSAGHIDPQICPPSTKVFVYRDRKTVAGLSRAGKITRDALAGTGLDIVDLDYAFGRERMQSEYAYNANQWRHADRAVHVLNLNPEYVPECLMCHLSSLSRSDYVIGQFYWELSDTSSIHECAFRLVDEIWVASEYLREVYSKRVEVPVIVMGQAVMPKRALPQFDRKHFDLGRSAYIFLVSFDAGSSVERKNPLGAARAFSLAFPEGTEAVQLVLKTKNTGSVASAGKAHWRRVLDAAEQDPRIRIIDSDFSEDEMAALHETCDCYVSLHRSEGFGFGPAEALARGKPAIVTNYSAVTDFCTAETALLVDFSLVEVEHGAYPYMDRDRTYVWASPDISNAAAQMRYLFEHPDAGRQLGAKGQALMAEQYTLRALADRYCARLRALGVLEP